VKLHRQLVLLVLAALLPLVALSAMLGAGALRQAQLAMRHDARERVAVIAAAISRELGAQIGVLQAVGASPLLDGDVADDRFDEIAARLLRQEPLWIAVTLTTPDGYRYRDFPHLPARVQRKVFDVTSHALAVRTGRPVIGHIMLGPRGRAAFAVFVPVIRQGKVVSVLNAVVQPGSLRAILIENGLPASWRASVMDGANHIVARSMLPDFATKPASPEAGKAMAASGEGLYRTPGADGVPLVTAYRVMPDIGWSVHVAIPQRLYDAPFARSLWLVGTGGAVSILLAGLFLWLLLRELRLRQSQQASLEEGLRLEALGRMTGGVAHDFNNLLMIVHGSAELLRRRVAGQERLEGWADSILTAVQRGQALTRQLLAFGRRGAHEPVGFDLHERAYDLLSLLRRSVAPDVTTELLVPPSSWPIFADPNALEVALINLAVNASDAMPQGGVLSISAANVVMSRGKDEETGLVGDYVALSVADTGVGIPQEHLVHVFEPFYTTKPAGKGTGLGLSQVYGFARQSDGAVTVRSKPGEGTTVTLYLPRATAAVVPSEARRDVAVAQGDGRALLVEDNAAVAEVAEQMLQASGYAVVRADSGEAALHLLDGDLAFVLSDIALQGGMSGLDLAEAVADRHPGLPVVLMTGYSEALARGSPGAFTVLAKPFSEAQLAAAVHRARSGARHEPRAPQVGAPNA
jgi:signal transduction histidine kinase/ActR/RegA family two-component response regulator